MVWTIHDSFERRKSFRWPADKPLQWKVARGRKVRRSRVTERSISGMVIKTKTQDAPRVGQRIEPGSAKLAERYGFRKAVVRRVSKPQDGEKQIFLEFVK